MSIKETTNTLGKEAEIMKKSYIIIIAGFCAAALFSCSKETIIENAQKSQITFGVENEIPGDDTKDSLGVEDKVLFNAGDKISVFDGKSHNIFTTAQGGGFTGRLKKLAGGAGTAITDDNNVKKIIFHTHTLVPQEIKNNDNLVSSGQQSGTAMIYARYVDGVVDVFTEAPTITLHINSYGLFRNFAALESVKFDNVTADAG